MNLTWHIFKKDARRLWIMLALFAVVIASKLAMGALLLWRGGSLDQEWFEQIRVYANLLIALEVIVGFFLVVALVQEDKLVGTDASWMTRPISGLRLLGAKALAAAIFFGVLPVVTTLPWWLAVGFGFREIGLAALETLLWQAPVVLMALPIATLTGAVSRALIWTLGGYLMLILLGSAVSSTSDAGPFVRAPVGVQETRGWIAFTLAVLTSVGVAVHQYRSRQLVRSSVLLAVGVLAIFGVARWWPWDWSPRRSEASEVRSRNIAMEFEGAKVEESPGVGGNPVISISVQITNIPEGFSIATHSSHETLRWPDGQKVVENRRQHRFSPDTSLFVRKLLDLPRRNEAVSPRSYSLTRSTTVTTSVLARIEKEPPSFELNARFRLMQPVVVGECPIQKGASIAREGYTVRLAEITLQEDQRIGISTVESMPALQWDGTSASPGAVFPVGDFITSNYLIDRAGGDLSFGSPSNGRVIESARIAAVGIIWRRNTFAAPAQEEAGVGLRWPETTRLAVTTSRKIEHFRRQLRVEQLKIER